jgi:hypothetical protein
MNSFVSLNCWDILKCKNIECSAREEPETSCWEIARKIENFKDFSETCECCVVYFRQSDIYVFCKKQIEAAWCHRKHPASTLTRHN